MTAIFYALISLSLLLSVQYNDPHLPSWAPSKGPPIVPALLRVWEVTPPMKSRGGVYESDCCETDLKEFSMFQTPPTFRDTWS